ncbi:diphthine--ammonia ligase [Trichomonascus vanleenenianus]|uniref:diphthine--ammonia ligase n=1 Tax=Trichomonascus vanleenenianus TaxID=2268995 RepID=UPI003ECAB546
MKFVALVSGGKDSMFNILHCIKNGHELEALANLHPPVDHGSDEMDSFMYQTVGYHALQHYSECLGVPMYRAEIKGKNVAQGLEYAPEENDETEDLYNLVKTVMEAHSDVKAVSVGAILSTYQRTRVESVCQRLGLTCLAYLWNRPQDELLDEIIDSGVDARIIKTAGIGLNRTHLGRSLGDIRSDLIKFNSMYGLHLCGEGGEYETLVLDAPIFRKRLQLHMDKSTVIDQPSEYVSYLSNIEVAAEEKPEGPNYDFELAVPDLLNTPGAHLFEQIKAIEIHDSLDQEADIPTIVKPHYSMLESDSQICFYNITAPDSPDVESEVRGIFDQLKSQLSKHNLEFDSLVSVSLLVSDMSTFAAVNKIYSEYFTKPNPASRACIQTVLPFRLQLSAVARKPSRNRSGLHVQSQSYWAPPNIGPYSQSIQAEELTTFAGQIGLIPATAQLESSPHMQIALSLQHVDKILTEVKSTLTSAVAFTTSSNIIPAATRAWDTYKPGAPLIIAQVEALPRGAVIEWTGTATFKPYLECVKPDDDDSEDEDNGSFVYPPSYTDNQVNFGNWVVCTVTARTGQELEDTIKRTNSVIATTLFATEAYDFTIPGEVIPAAKLYDKSGTEYPFAAVFSAVL